MSSRQHLICPVHFEALEYQSRSVPFEDTSLACPSGCEFPVVNGIPRFVKDGYAEGFGLQWKRYPRTQLDSYTGLPISRQRLERCLGVGLESLADKSVLEIGSGAGRFTELLAPHCGRLVSADLSAAVDANLENCAGLGDYILIQADVRALPLASRSFDYVVCLGVVQHTPSSEETIRHLASFVRPGGALVIDHYRRWPGAVGLAQRVSATAALRPLVKRLSRTTALRVCTALSRACDPIQWRTSRIPKLDMLVSRLLPTANVYRRFPELPRAIAREWNELNTHDRLTDWYKHRRTSAELSDYLTRLGFDDVVTLHAGNGVEVRAQAAAVPREISADDSSESSPQTTSRTQTGAA